MRIKKSAVLLNSVALSSVLIGIICFIICSLLTYNSHDQSWFYVTTHHSAVTNACSFPGAWCAAFLVYLWGGMAFIVIIPLLCLVYMSMFRQPFTQEWERLLAACVLLVVTTAFCAVHQIDFSWSPYPGGAFGLLLARLLSLFFDPLCTDLILCTGGAASCIVLARFFFMPFIQLCMHALCIAIGYIKQYRITQHCTHLCTRALYYICIHPFILFKTFVHSLLDGSAFDDTDLIVPDDENKYEIVQEWRQTEQTSQSDLSELQNSTIDSTHDGDSNTVQVLSYVLPRLDIFIAHAEKSEKKELFFLEKDLEERAQVLKDKLKRFGINGEITAIKCGPVVTLFEYQPDADTKLSKIVVLEDDLAMALQALSIRIIAPIPGRSVVGFEVANTRRHDVLFCQVIESPAYLQSRAYLPLILGKDTIGQAVVVDLARMPHLLIAGSTGSGKSVALNGMLISLLCKKSPDELKLILIDPKRLEFAPFADIAHLLFPIVTQSHYAIPVLKWVVQEMEQRYEKMAVVGAKNILDYNVRVSDDQDALFLPAIVVIIDELADLMLTTGPDIEALIARITQMARAAGIHMIVATQRPSVDVITGLIKANFPSRISFRVASRIDSRTILDCGGADRLLGRGDMLYMDASTSHLARVHGAYVSDTEIERVVAHIKEQRTVSYLDFHAATLATLSQSEHHDELYEQVCHFLHEVDEVSISLLQRRFRIGFNRSARIIDILESQGRIMPTDGSKTRKVIR